METPNAPVEFFGDPATGKAIITLNDGIERVMRFDHCAVCVLEQVSGLPYSRAISQPFSATAISLYVYAGCLAHATARGEEWTLQKVNQLIDIAAYAPLYLKARWAIAIGQRGMAQNVRQLEGEFRASVQKKPKRRPGRGSAR